MKPLYVILFHSYKDDDAPMIGYLPFTKIPKDSILRDALFSEKHYLQVDGLGLKGIYEDRNLATEHLKLERAWRIHDEVWMRILFL